MKKWLPAIAVLAVNTVTQPSHSAPAIIFDTGGKFDWTFNQSASAGAEAWKKESNSHYVRFSLQNEEQREKATQNLAAGGNQPVVVIGFAGAPSLEKLAPQFPKTQFYLIDAVVDKPNVKSVVFREQEGSFLVGALAAMKSATGKIGFIGGMDVPVIRRFACGYEQGAKYINPKIIVLQNMIGTGIDAWNDHLKGAELAQSQLDRGAEVIFAAAGATGLGVLRAAAAAKKYSIGVDSNQNYLHPGSILTSMVKRVDLAVHKAFTEGSKGQVGGGIESIGMKEGGIDWTLDQHNRSLITKKIETRANQIKKDIISGKIKVVDYAQNNSCPL